VRDGATRGQEGGTEARKVSKEGGSGTSRWMLGSGTVLFA
jgi:hypothetical protein